MHIFQVFGFISWAVLSAIWVELVRDLWHRACHKNDTLYKWIHSPHHDAYKLHPIDQTYLVTSEELWRKSQWRHGLPESVVMLSGTLILALAATLITHGWVAIGTSVGVFRALREVLSVVLHGLGLARETDFLHQSRKAEAPPEQWIVNFAYHWRHHFENPQAYFGGVNTLLDGLLGTALSLRRKRVAITNIGSPLGTALAERFEQEGAIVTEVTPEISLDAIDILVFLDSDSQHLLLPFFQTVSGNRAIARKECWWVSSSPSQPSFPSSTRKIAPCTTRQILLLASAATSSKEIVGQILFQAKRHVVDIVVAKDPVIFLLYWLNLLTNQLWVRYTQGYHQSASF